MANVPHIRAEYIKAWADGEKIQYSNDKVLWLPLPREPSWLAPYYRIKPSPPAEPDYGAIAKNEWVKSAVPAHAAAPSPGWANVAKEVIKAYQAHEKALKDFQD